MNKIIGRKKEIETFQKLYQEDRSSFVAVYGRRRVGKTFLIKELFKDKYAFHVTGLSNGNLKVQLANFYASLNRFYPNNIDQPIPKNWFDTFQLLIRHLETNSAERKVIFIDELPWLDTRKSGFTTALEHFWNGWAFHRDDILLIVCGSATSWMINQLINNHGGLHNRVTTRMHLQPFSLSETETFLKHKGGVYDRYQIIQLYMAMGGIPFYLDDIDVSQSIAQNIDRLFFEPQGLLRTEFNNLYLSLFKRHERHVSIIHALAKKAKGMSRKDLIKVTKMSNSGSFTRILQELEQCGFITKYIPFGKKNRDSLYQLTDPYSLFYLKFIKDNRAKGEGVWMTQLDLPKWRAWSGYAFESICFYHIKNIKAALGIQSIYTEISAWRSMTSKNGLQIDLILDRRDRIINICEIKFSENPYIITKSYADNLAQKLTTFKTETGTNKTLFLTLITTFGLKPNKHSIRLVQKEVTMNALFD